MHIPHSFGAQVVDLRYAYVKNGDVIEQLQSMAPAVPGPPDSGPNAFLGEFLFNVNSQPLLLMSNAGRDAHDAQANIEAHVFRSRSSLFHPAGTLLLRGLAFLKILRELWRFKPDRLLCGTLGFSLWACYLFARLQSRPLVHSLHNRLDYRDLPWYKRPAAAIDKFILRRIGRVICHGPFLRQQLLGIGVKENRITEFDCGFRDMWQQIDSDPALNVAENGRHRLITYLGRMEYSKGIGDLAEACAVRLLADPALRLVYAGAGPDLAELKARVRQMQLQDSVSFLGQLSHDKLAGILHQSHVVVTPTRSRFPEGRCMATMEGLAMKIPVIAPDFGPFPYLVQHGVNGLLFRPDSVDDLRSKISAVLDDAALYAVLCKGAQETSKILLDPPVTFYKAVQWAFAQPAGH